MDRIQEMLSIYSVLALLILGVYMTFKQSKAMDGVSHLEREAKFTKIIGYIYIVLGIASGIVLMI